MVKPISPTDLFSGIPDVLINTFNQAIRNNWNFTKNCAEFKASELYDFRVPYHIILKNIDKLTMLFGMYGWDIKFSDYAVSYDNAVKQYLDDIDVVVRAKTMENTNICK